jgi:protein SCO1
MQRVLRLWTAAVAALGLAMALLATPSAAGRWDGSYVPNVPVVTQDGKVLRFWDDLIKDKIFVISFFYTSCTQICPLATARLSELQSTLGDAMGRDIFFYTISVDPENDTPARLKTYAEAMQAGPGWLFLTGIPEDIKAIRDKLGDRAKALNEHRNEVLLGNGATGEWQRDNPLSDLPRLGMTIRAMRADWRAERANPPRASEPAPLANTASMHAMFAKACAGCHSIGRGDRVGPDLAGVAERRQTDWLMRFIANPDSLRRQKDPIALALMHKYPTIRMPAMGISEGEALDLLAYIQVQQPKKPTQLSLDALLALTTQDGRPLSASRLAGRPLVIAFGYTHCPMSVQSRCWIGPTCSKNWARRANACRSYSSPSTATEIRPRS